jgi:hypothetical protein
MKSFSIFHHFRIEENFPEAGLMFEKNLVVVKN